jgi:hypothetical protein
MIAGTNPNNIVTAATSSWYGLAPLPSEPYAWRRPFDAGQFLSDLFFPNAAPPASPLDTPFYLELNALSILKNELTPPAPEPQRTEDALTKLIASRMWPTNWPPSTPAIAEPVQTIGSGSALLGQILNIVV